MAYLTEPGEEESFAHPAGGDVCTAVTFGADRWHHLAGDRAARTTVYADAALELAHRRAVASAADPDYALAEQLLVLVGRAITQASSRPGGALVARASTQASPRPGTAATLVARARDALAADVPEAAGLFPLAELLGISPYRLSRAFPQELGVSLTRYRNRVRVGRALDRLEAGERSLAALAAELGFADQAHLTRTVRDHTGETPRPCAASCPNSQAKPPTTRDAPPITRDAPPITRDAPPITRDASPITRDASPITRDASPITRDARPITRSGRPTARTALPKASPRRRWRPAPGAARACASNPLGTAKGSARQGGGVSKGRRGGNGAGRVATPSGHVTSPRGRCATPGSGVPFSKHRTGVS
ncbi:helix-turn-helix domain-containing protein [Amycolatopsis stemonae]